MNLIFADRHLLWLGSLVHLAIIALKAHHIEEVSNQCLLDFEVEGTITGQAWRQVDFHDPRLQKFVQHDVIAEHFEAAGWVDVVLTDAVDDELLTSDETLNNNIIDS